MTHITLKQLRYFDALARLQHFGKAADQCAVTQPALSMQIRELEQSLGLDLVERTPSGVYLTEKGREIASRAERILADVRALIDFARHCDTVLTGTLKLGVIPSIAPYLLPPLLPLVRAGFPALELSLRETQTAHLVGELAAGKLDCILLALPLDQPDFDSVELFRDRFLLALPAGGGLTGSVRATREMIAGERLLLLEEGHCLRDQALSYCSLRDVEGLNTFGASSLSTIVEMVAAGYGITLLPEISVPIETRGRALKLMAFAEPEPFRTIGLAWRRTSPRRRDFDELGRLLVEARRRLADPLARAIGGAEPAAATAPGEPVDAVPARKRR